MFQNDFIFDQNQIAIEFKTEETQIDKKTILLQITRNIVHMNEAYLKQLNTIFEETLDIENVSLTNETTADDIEEWDSLSHILLVVAIEKFFKIRFTSKEIQTWKNIGDLIFSISQKKE